MAQTIEECLAFLNGARDALDELSLLAEQEERLSQEEERLEKKEKELFLFVWKHLQKILKVCMQHRVS